MIKHIIWKNLQLTLGLPVSTNGKEPAAGTGDLRPAGLIPGSERSSGGGRGNLL